MALTFKANSSGNGGQQLVISAQDLPQFLIDAKTAIEAGQIEEAERLLNDPAVEALGETLENNPSQTSVMFMLALMFGKIGQTAKAEHWYRKILEIEPDPFTLYKLGRICRSTNRISESREYGRKALEAEPENTLFQISLALDNIREGQAKQGVDLLRKIVEKEPGNSDAHSKLLFHMHFLPEPDQRSLFEEHRRWGQTHAPMSLARAVHTNEPDPERKLRVAYLSPDFRIHATTYNFAPLLEAHDREAVEVYGYGNVARPDNYTEYLQQRFDLYRNVFGMSDEAVADMIERDKVDILVTMGGHIGGNRLVALARKPAPVQVDYGGLNTTGMEQIDYRITDEIIDLPELRQFYTEESVCLPGGLFCYKPPEFAPPIGPLAAKQNGYITFGSFSNNLKINPNTLALWAEVLKANDGSVLLMKFKEGGDPIMKDYYLTRFAEFGVDPKRIRICGWKSPVEHMQLYGRVDIALDTFPFNGCMTTLEGLWIGVPTISLVGNGISLSRSGLSILSRLGLEFFAASTPEEYIAKATALARNIDGLEKIHNTTRQRMAASTICDADRFAREMEAAYRIMWRRWCRDGSSGIQSESAESNPTTCFSVTSDAALDCAGGSVDGPRSGL